MPGDRLRQGRAYVHRLRRAGRSERAIQRGLLDAGWAEQDVAAVLEPTPRVAVERATPADSSPVAAAAPRERSPSAAPPQRPLALSISMGIVGVLSAIGALIGLAVLVLVAREISISGGPSDFPSQLGFGYALGAIAIGALCLGPLAVSYYVWHGREWARVAMIGLMFFGLMGAAYILPAVIAAPVIYVLFRQDVKDYCSR